MYTGDVDADAREILKKAQNRFNVKVSEKDVNFVFLRRRGWVVAERYPYFTMLGQSLGSMVLGMEAALKYPPDVFIDTMGYAFTFPIFKYLASSSVGAYVHYPTISTDMLRRVRARSKSHNNNKFVASNPFLTSIKLFYYKVFAWVSGVTILGDWISLGVEERFYYFRSEIYIYQHILFHVFIVILC